MGEFRGHFSDHSSLTRKFKLAHKKVYASSQESLSNFKQELADAGVTWYENLEGISVITAQEKVLRL